MRWLPDPAGPTAIIATLFLVGCATVAPQVVKLLPPAELLADCKDIPDKPTTNGALAKQRDDLKASIKECNADKKALREWAERAE